jgi:hypothetical protein
VVAGDDRRDDPDRHALDRTGLAGVVSDRAEVIADVVISGPRRGRPPGRRENLAYFHSSVIQIAEFVPMQQSRRQQSGHSVLLELSRSSSDTGEDGTTPLRLER